MDKRIRKTNVVIMDGADITLAETELFWILPDGMTISDVNVKTSHNDLSETVSNLSKDATIASLKKSLKSVNMLKDMWAIKFSIEKGSCSYLETVGGEIDHLPSYCNQCLLHVRLEELEREYNLLMESEV